jgi:osmotically-inducible protein OsmY
MRAIGTLQHLVTAVLCLGVLWVPVQAAEPAVNDLTERFAEEGLLIRKLTAVEFAGIVIIRGETDFPGEAAAAGRLATQLGFTRIANLVRVLDWEATDAALESRVRRELMNHPSLAGARLRVDAERGVLVLEGTVRHALQKDAAIALARAIDGVASVESKLVVAD